MVPARYVLHCPFCRADLPLRDRGDALARRFKATVCPMCCQAIVCQGLNTNGVLTAKCVPEANIDSQPHAAALMKYAFDAFFGGLAVDVKRRHPELAAAVRRGR